ncbi:MAG: hypothetical protein LBU25_01970 [Treponema sp.]|nr:hypothetical protein [Treponema sp.]
MPGALRGAADWKRGLGLEQEDVPVRPQGFEEAPEEQKAAETWWPGAAPRGRGMQPGLPGGAAETRLSGAAPQGREQGMQPGLPGEAEEALRQEDPVKPAQGPVPLKQGKRRGLQPGEVPAEQALPPLDMRVRQEEPERAGEELPEEGVGLRGSVLLE